MTATVPTGATTGKISVDQRRRDGTSTADFTVTGAGRAHDLSVRVRRNSRVSGQVNVSNGLRRLPFVWCRVVIQKQKNGGWKWADTTATTAAALQDLHPAEQRDVPSEGQ